MVRQRKVVQIKVGNNENSSSSASSDSSETSKYKLSRIWKVVGFLCLVIAVYSGALGYLQTRVNTPFGDEKVVSESGIAVPDRYWGSYRPGVYFGLKSREPYSPVFGLMWYELEEAHKGVRHWCDQNDNLASYGWTRHDGVTFGEQTVIDEPNVLTTSFVKSGLESGGQWTARISVRNRHNATHSSPLNVIWYVAADEAPPSAPPTRLWLETNSLRGHTKHLGHFKVDFVEVEGRILHVSAAEANAEGPHLLKEKLFTLLKVAEHPTLGRHVVLTADPDISTGADRGSILVVQTAAPPPPPQLEEASPGLCLDHGMDDVSAGAILRALSAGNHKGAASVFGISNMLKCKEVNLVAVQLQVMLPFTMDVVYTAESQPLQGLQAGEYTRVLNERKQAFDEEFEKKFKLTEKGYSESGVSIAKAALSNLIGGIGYFYGSGRVRSDYTAEPVPYWRAPLYTAVPSRSFFPRGFLWDEGFHLLLTSRWSPEIALDVAAHWLDLANVEGWIPREQILGSEALARVPKEFVVQSNAAGNPPMLAIALARLVVARGDLFHRESKHRAMLDRMFTRLQAWYQWFLTTQKGADATSFRWRGRVDDGLQLNPKTLASGLDDYPRASHPSDEERHIDLRCWIHAAADAMATIAKTLDRDPTKFEATRDQLGDEDSLNQLHWSPHTNTYADYGLHSENVALVTKGGKHREDPPRVIRKVASPPQYKLVTAAYGYVSLFPLLLRILKPGSPNLGKMLEDLDKPELLWSSYGLRSLSKSSPYYMQRNTKDDPPYWRGQVWININYLALSALKHYSDVEGPYRERARELHGRLKNNVVGNLLSEYKRTGYLWEQYSDQTGEGSGCKPFTGWSALLVLMMAEEY